VGFLGGFFRCVNARLVGEIFAAEMALDVFAGVGDRFRSDVDGIGTHISNETFGSFFAHVDPFIESLCDAHSTGYRKAIVAARLLLERRGDEGRDGIPLSFFFLDVGDEIIGVLQLVDDRFSGLGVGDQETLFVAHFFFFDFEPIDCMKGGEERLVDRLSFEHSADAPVFDRMECVDFLLSVYDEL